MIHGGISANDLMNMTTRRKEDILKKIQEKQKYEQKLSGMFK